MSVKSFFGIKWSTTSQTTASIINDDTVLDWSALDVTGYVTREKDGLKKFSVVSCCPEILSVRVEIFPTCVNAKCKRKVEVFGGQIFVNCAACARRLSVSKCPCSLNCTIDVEKDECTTTLTTFKDVLSTFFEEDIVQKYKGDPAVLEDTLLELEKIDFSYNTREIITSMNRHKEEDTV